MAKEKINQLKIELDLKLDKKEENLKYYVAFSNMLNTSPLFKSRLFEYFDFNPKRAYLASREEISNMCEFYEIPMSQDFFRQREKLDIEECYKNAFLDKNIKILTYEDEKYPKLLREIPDFPLALYYKGNLDLIDDESNLAVVGSRKATQEAKNALNNIIRGFKGTNLTIVSGLAYGIDAQAHQSAINYDLKTIGVIGCGLDIIYPTQNKKLYEDIISSFGLVMSEYPQGTQPMPRNFPQRNRIVVGMSKGTLVVEARLKSGAMISANLTLDYNRELMCMPGNLMNPNTEGIYHLIKNGASMVVDSKDILSALGWEINLEEDLNPEFELDENQKIVYDIISYEAKNFDEIMAEIEEIDVSSVMVTLTELELQGLIKQTNNKYYRCK